MLASCRDNWERDFARLAPHKKMKKRDAFEEWLYRRKEEDTAIDEFRRYSIAGSAIPATERFDPIDLAVVTVLLTLDLAVGPANHSSYWLSLYS